MANIDEFEDDLQQLKNEGSTMAELVAYLSERGIQTSLRTLERRFQAWGIRERTGQPITDALANRVKDIYRSSLLSDSEIASKIAEEEGLSLSPWQVSKIRRQHGLLRRIRSTDLASQQRSKTHDLVHTMLVNGPGRSFGQRWTVTYLRARLGHRARRHDVANALKELAPRGVASRIPGKRKERLQNYITPGVNHHWSCDGHDKLARYGIQLYAAIDAYSRKIIWFYVGNANRSQYSVGNQYLQAVRAFGRAPKFLRTDHGTETVLLAAIHLTFYLESLAAEGMDPDDVDDIQALSKCYIYGKSTANIRIESTWRQIRDRVTGKWLRLFGLMEASELYLDSLVADRIVLLFVFMPLIRYELNEFVQVKNEHPIRRQRNRELHVPGIPNDLFERGDDISFPVDITGAAFTEWAGKLTTFGKFFTATINTSANASHTTIPTSPTIPRSGVGNILPLSVTLNPLPRSNSLPTTAKQYHPGTGRLCEAFVPTSPPTVYQYCHLHHGHLSTSIAIW
jgi:hypothetical protein